MEGQEPVAKKPRLSQKLMDPLAPKKPISSYFAFMNAERAGVREALGGTNNMAEVGKELGRRWGELGPEARVQYELLSKQDKERYNREMDDYKPSEEFLRKKAEVEAAAKEPKFPSPSSPKTTDEYFAFLFTNWLLLHNANPAKSPKDIQDEVWQQWVSVTTAVKKPRKERDPAAPKRPMSSYLLFAGDQRAEVARSLPLLGYKELTVELGRRWGELGEEGKAPYVASAAKLKVAYDTAVRVYREEAGKVEGNGKQEQGRGEAGDE
jgi:upstream-binding transcription factor